MLAARQHDSSQLAAAYAEVDAVILSIDGLQPEKGHATLYVVRELECKRVWFAEALLSSATAEVQQLLAQGGAGRRGSANWCGSGYRINRTRSSAGSRRSSQEGH